MINNLKNGLKLLRFAYGIKLNCIQAGMFALVGLLSLFMGEGGTFGLMGGFFWVSIGILPTQLVYSLSVSGLVKTSPMEKRLQTVIPVAVNLFSMIVVYFLGILLCGIRFGTKTEQAAELGQDLVMLAVVMALVMVYLGICYKHFIIATLALVPLLVFWMQGGMKRWMRLSLLYEGRTETFWLSVLAGAGILAAGGLAEYLLTLLLYRRPLAKMAQAAPLRKEL